MKREDLFMDILGDLDEKYVASAMPHLGGDAVPDNTSAVSRLTAGKPVEISKKEIRRYMIMRMLGMAAALVLISGAVLFLWQNWSMITTVIFDPDNLNSFDRPTVSTTGSGENADVTVPAPVDSGGTELAIPTGKVAKTFDILYEYIGYDTMPGGEPAVADFDSAVASDGVGYAQIGHYPVETVMSGIRLNQDVTPDLRRLLEQYAPETGDDIVELSRTILNNQQEEVTNQENRNENTQDLDLNMNVNIDLGGEDKEIVFDTDGGNNEGMLQIAMNENGEFALVPEDGSVNSADNVDNANTSDVSDNADNANVGGSDDENNDNQEENSGQSSESLEEDENGENGENGNVNSGNRGRNNRRNRRNNRNNNGNRGQRANRGNQISRR